MPCPPADPPPTLPPPPPKNPAALPPADQIEVDGEKNGVNALSNGRMGCAEDAADADAGGGWGTGMDAGVAPLRSPSNDTSHVWFAEDACPKRDEARIGIRPPPSGPPRGDGGGGGRCTPTGDAATDAAAPMGLWGGMTTVPAGLAGAEGAPEGSPTGVGLRAGPLKGGQCCVVSCLGCVVCVLEATGAVPVHATAPTGLAAGPAAARAPRCGLGAGRSGTGATRAAGDAGGMYTGGLLAAWMLACWANAALSRAVSTSP